MSNVNIRQLKDPASNEVFYPQTDVMGLVHNGEYGVEAVPTAGSVLPVQSGGVLDSIIKDGSAFDLSAYTGDSYASLSAALTAMNGLPAAYKKGGMSIKYVQTYDNNYVQWRLMADAFTTNVAQWQGVDEVPTVGSDNLVKSGGAAKCINNITGYVALNQDVTVGSSTINNDYPCIVDSGKDVIIELSNPKTDRVGLAFLDANGDSVQSLGTVLIGMFPLKVKTTADAKKLKVGVWSTSWITGIGDFNIAVKVDGVLEDITQKIENNSDFVIGESLLEYEVDIAGKYISMSGGTSSQANSIITKPIHFNQGDKACFIVPDSGFCAIGVPVEGGGYTSLFNYIGANTYKEYEFESAIDACVTVMEGSTITVKNGKGISARLDDTTDTTNHLDFISEAITRNEKADKYILNVSDGVTTSTIIDVSLVKGYTYKVTNNNSENSAISLFGYNRKTSSYDGTLVTNLQQNKSAEFVASKDLMAVIVTSTASTIKFDIVNPNSPTNRLDEKDVQVLDINTRVIKDNLHSDGIIRKIGRIIKNGQTDSDWYGYSNVRYEFDIPNDFSDLYVYFEWQAQQALADLDTTAIVLTRLLNGLIRDYYLVGDWGISENGNIYRKTYYGTSKDGYPYSAGLVPPSQAGLFPEKYFSYKGRDSFWVRYTGMGSVASIKIEDNGITLTVDGTDTLISISSSASINSVVQTLNEVADLEAGVVDAGSHVYADILHSSTLNIPLIYTITPNTGETPFTDKLRIYIPYTHDDLWHSSEILLRLSESKMYINHDGFTAVIDLTSRMSDINALMKSASTSILAIGADYNNGNTPLNFRNLEIEVGSCGSAEIVEFRCPIPNASGTPYDRRDIWQMISNHNPKVIIYECHGELVGTDSDYPVDPTQFTTETAMSCTTDRLIQVFAYAKSKGYEFVSVKDIIEWKINGKPLPKRSMTIVFDDFRVQNFVDLRKRKPFKMFDMKPGMLIVTRDDLFTETYTINGLEYTGQECIEEIINEGWYLFSHSKDHRMNHRGETCEERIELLNQDALSADKHRIHTDSFAYGGDNMAFYEIAGLKSSIFPTFINGMSHDYICRGVNNYYINRVDMGLRLNIDNVLAPLG